MRDPEVDRQPDEQGAAGIVRLFERAWRTAASVFLFAIMIIIVVDVVSRYLLNSPLPWAFDVVSMYLMTGLFFLMLSDTLRADEHVRVDILYAKAPARARRWMDLVSSVLALAVFAAILCTSIRTTWSSWSAGDVVAGSIPWPAWISHVFIPLGVALLVLRLAIDVVRTATAIAGRGGDTA
ncbi:MAG: TRAP transporter small permease [Burkholderiaceae bacterium]|nr:TRAP transporter small permease [Burkholderiaceae bacterium]